MNAIMKGQEYVAYGIKTECFARKEVGKGGRENESAKQGKELWVPALITRQQPCVRAVSPQNAAFAA